MKFENDKIIFENSYDIDHVFGLFQHINLLDNSIIENVKDNLIFELNLVGTIDENIFEKKIEITSNKKEKDFPTSFEKFSFMLKEFYIEKDNKNIIPYYGEDIN